MAYKAVKPTEHKSLLNTVKRGGGTKFYSKNPSKINKGKAKIGNK
jgi:predicted transcriptional regulator